MKNILKIIALLSVGLVSTSGRAAESLEDITPNGPAMAQILTQTLRKWPDIPSGTLLVGSGDKPAGSGIRRIGEVQAVLLALPTAELKIYGLMLLGNRDPKLLGSMGLAPQR